MCNSTTTTLEKVKSHLSSSSSRSSRKISRIQNSLHQVNLPFLIDDDNNNNNNKNSNSNGSKDVLVRKSILRVKTLDESLRFDSSASAAALSASATALSIESRESIGLEGTEESAAVRAPCGSSDNSDSTSQQQQQQQHRPRESVSFSDITIREYNITIGDNPSCSSGAPISLHWSYDPNHISCTVDCYEDGKKDYPPRKRSAMIIPMSVRHVMLQQEWDVKPMEIARITKEIAVIQVQRYKTAISQDRLSRAEALLKKCFRWIPKI
jgi:hypothetical protein